MPEQKGQALSVRRKRLMKSEFSVWEIFPRPSLPSPPSGTMRAYTQTYTHTHVHTRGCTRAHDCPRVSTWRTHTYVHRPQPGWALPLHAGGRRVSPGSCRPGRVFRLRAHPRPKSHTHAPVEEAGGRGWSLSRAELPASVGLSCVSPGDPELRTVCGPEAGPPVLRPREIHPAVAPRAPAAQAAEGQPGPCTREGGWGVRPEPWGVSRGGGSSVKGSLLPQ